MYENLIDLLKLFTGESSPSSYEQGIQDILKKQMSNYASSCETDVIGNVIAHFNSGSKKRIMIIAHSDEIGLIINYIADNGLIHFTRIGGVDVRVLPGSRVWINHKGTIIDGVIAASRGMASGESIECKDLWIDIGASDKEDALKLVSIGDYITFCPCFTEMRNHVVSSKALDDRAGLVVLCEIARRVFKQSLNGDLFLVSSVQEEIGSRGACPAVYSINPDICITVDVTFATDYPGMDVRERGDIKLSSGPVITVGAEVSNQLQETLIQLAEKKGIPFQIEAQGRTTRTDASRVQISRSGVQSGLVSIPCRYMHSATEVVSLSDIEGVISLLSAYLTETI